VARKSDQKLVFNRLGQGFLQCLDYGLLSMADQSNVKENLTLWPESASELYRPSDSRLSAKLVQYFADRRCHVVSVTDPLRS
jgi:hypothetical protein